VTLYLPLPARLLIWYLRRPNPLFAFFISRKEKQKKEKTAYAMASWLSEIQSGFSAGIPSIDDPDNFQLPDNNDLPRPGRVTDRVLCIITHQSTIELYGIGLQILWEEIQCLRRCPRIDQLIARLYHRVTGHPVLDKPYRGLRSRRLKDPLPREENSDFLRTVYASIHNFLCHLRLQRLQLEKREMYHTTRRIMTYFQEKWPGPGIGDISTGAWWIAPDCYMLEIDPAGLPDSKVEEVYELSADALTAKGDEDIATAFGTDRGNDAEKFANAIYTFHLVYLQGGDWALIIRHSTTDTAICIDPVFRSDRGIWSRIEQEFNNWLGKSKQNHIKNFRFPTPPAVTRPDWDCGIHVIAHALAFLRFGVPNWAEIPRWRRADTGLPDSPTMVADITESLHRLMGITTREILKRRLELDEANEEGRKRVKTGE